MNPWRRLFQSLLLGLLTLLLTVVPGRAADLLYLRYGLLGLSLPVQALETFVETGTDPRIDTYLNWLSPAQRSQLQRALQTNYALDPRVVSQFTYTASGELLLQEAGEMIRTAAGLNGFSSLRSAAILTAADTSGSNALTFLRHLPVDMQVDVRRALALRQQVARLLAQTAQVTQHLQQQTLAAQTTPWDSTRPDLRQPGTLAVQTRTLTFQDPGRDRTLTLDLYWPDSPTPAPVIVASNGLGAKRDRFTRLAHHLASHGFAVVAPDHPGSDRERLREFYLGLHRENFDTTEFVDRPLDVTFLLNQLEQINATELNGGLNLDQVGVFGYSFGGTTALSLAGAEMDFAALQHDCTSQTFILNISLLYQCQMLDLPQPGSLRDPRVRAIYVFLPFGQSLFGSGLSQITIPILWEATNADFLTPLPIEQVPSFQRITAPDRYFVMSQGLPHARINHDIARQFTPIQDSWEDLKALSERYLYGLTLAFFKTYLAQDESYRPFLTAEYAAHLSEDPYPLTLVQSIAPLAD